MCRLSFGGLDAAVNSDQNKRGKHESSDYSGASFDTHSNFLAEQATSAEELGAAEVDTSFRSTDNDNTGDDDYSRCDTSAFSSGEEGFSQRLECRDPFLQSDRRISAFKQSHNKRDDSWNGERNLLQLQLGSFIQKEKLKLESESEGGSSGLSRHSLSSSLGIYDSIDSVTGIPDDRFSGNSGSLSGFLRGSSSFAESSENTGHHGEIYSSRTSSMLSSIVRNKKTNGFNLPMKKDEAPARLHSNMHAETEQRVSLSNSVQVVSWPSVSSARLEEPVYKSGSVHQKFVLSSGRPSNVTGIFCCAYFEQVMFCIYVELLSALLCRHISLSAIQFHRCFWKFWIILTRWFWVVAFNSSVKFRIATAFI